MNQGYVSRKDICWEKIEQIGIGLAYLCLFLSTMHGIDAAAEVYLELFQAYVTELFFMKIGNGTRKKAPS